MSIKHKLDPRTCAFGADVIEKHLMAMTKEIEGVVNSEDIEYIHRMRVASRRLRSALPLFRACFSKNQISKWLNEIKTITQSLGNARDLDVQIEKLNNVIEDTKVSEYHPGLHRLNLRLRQKRQKTQTHVIILIEGLQRSPLLTDLQDALRNSIDQFCDEPYTLPLYQCAYDAIQQKLDIFLAGEEHIFNPANIQELHQMRIEAKRLRYTLEVFAQIYPGECKSELKIIKSAQELLGDIHDCDVWISFLPRFLEEETQRVLDYYGHTRPMNILRPGINYLLAVKQQERESLYAQFIQQWQKWKDSETWQVLNSTIAAPLTFQNSGLSG
jgi:CHAD domain-containing protein